jgi:hypothetical protein
LPLSTLNVASEESLHVRVEWRLSVMYVLVAAHESWHKTRKALAAVIAGKALPSLVVTAQTLAEGVPTGVMIGRTQV